MEGISGNRVPKVSIIVPVYKVEKYLRKCIDSIINQTLKDIEIILVDDGSPDKCGKICDEYAAKDTRIKVIHKENGGLSSARNAGMEVAEGEYIGFVDSDDWIESDMYMTLWQKAKDINADLVNCDYFRNNDRIKTNIQKNIVYDKKCIDELLTTSNSNKVLWFVWRNIYRRELINDYNIHFMEGNVIEDSPFNLLFLLNCNKICSIDSAFYHYIENPDSIMMSKDQNGLTLKLSRLIKEKIRIYNTFSREELKQDLYNYTISHTLVMLLSNLFMKRLKLNELVTELGRIRNSEMIASSYKNCNSINSVTYKLKIILYLMKYRLYFVVAALSSLR